MEWLKRLQKQRSEEERITEHIKRLGEVHRMESSKNQLCSTPKNIQEGSQVTHLMKRGKLYCHHNPYLVDYHRIAYFSQQFLERCHFLGFKCISATADVKCVQKALLYSCCLHNASPPLLRWITTPIRSASLALQLWVLGAVAAM